MTLTKDNVIFLAQLVEGMREEYNHLNQAYAKNDKRRFDNAVAALLEFQSKIAYLVKKK